METKISKDTIYLYEYILSTEELGVLTNNNFSITDYVNIEFPDEYNEIVAVRSTFLKDSLFYNEIKKSKNTSTFNSYLTNEFLPEKNFIDSNVYRSLINIYSNYKNDGYIFDPFAGSSRVALECKFLGEHFIGCEFNPIKYLISHMKINAVNEIDRIKNSRRKFLYKIINTDDQKDIYNFVETEIERDIVGSFYKMIVINAVNNVYECGRYTISESCNFLINKYLTILENLKHIIKKYNINWNKYKFKLDYLSNAKDVDKELKNTKIKMVLTELPTYINYLKNDEKSFNFLGINKKVLLNEMIGVEIHGRRNKKNFDKYLDDLKGVVERCYYWLENNSYFIAIVGRFVLLKDNYTKEIFNIFSDVGLKIEKIINMKDNKYILITKKN